MSVCPYGKTGYSVFSKNLLKQFQVSFWADKNNGHFTWRQYVHLWEYLKVVTQVGRLLSDLRSIVHCTTWRTLQNYSCTEYLCSELEIVWKIVSFPGIKLPGLGVNHPPLTSAKVKERIQLYLYPPFGSSWPVLGWTLPFTSNTKAAELEVLKRAVCCLEVLAEPAVGLLAPSRS